MYALHKEYRAVQKWKDKLSNKKKEEIFSDKLEQIFDISHGNILKVIDAQQKAILLTKSLIDVFQWKSNLKMESLNNITGH